MSKRMFTSEQIEELSKNKNVVRCSEKSITYSKDFKREAVRQYNEECLSAKEIFEQAGFNSKTNSRKQPKECLQRWNKTYKTKGADGLVESRGKAGKGGRPKKNGLTDAEKIKWLEVENAYLKAENDFLAKLRAKRRE
jgi:transposase